MKLTVTIIITDFVYGTLRNIFKSTNQTTEPEEDEEDRFLYDTAPPSTPISRVDPENDPRNLKNGDFPENCDQLKSVKAHVSYINIIFGNLLWFLGRRI